MTDYALDMYESMRRKRDDWQTQAQKANEECVRLRRGVDRLQEERDALAAICDAQRRSGLDVHTPAVDPAQILSDRIRRERAQAWDEGYAMGMARDKSVSCVAPNHYRDAAKGNEHGDDDD